MPPFNASSFALRIFIVYVFMTIFFMATAKLQATAMKNIYQFVMMKLSPELSVGDITIEKQNSQLMFVVVLSNKKPLQHGALELPVATEVQASTMVGNMAQGSILLFSLILAWPLIGLQKKATALLLGIFINLCLNTLDISCVLIGALWETYYAYLEPGLPNASFSIQMMHLLSNGGRLALGVVGGLISVVASEYFFTVRASKKENEFIILI
jgi:hypothetical protein